MPPPCAKQILRLGYRASVPPKISDAAQMPDSTGKPMMFPVWYRFSRSGAVRRLGG